MGNSCSSNKAVDESVITKEQIKEDNKENEEEKKSTTIVVKPKNQEQNDEQEQSDDKENIPVNIINGVTKPQQEEKKEMMDPKKEEQKETTKIKPLNNGIYEESPLPTKREEKPLTNTSKNIVFSTVKDKSPLKKNQENDDSSNIDWDELLDEYSGGTQKKKSDLSFSSLYTSRQPNVVEGLFSQLNQKPVSTTPINQSMSNGGSDDEFDFDDETSTPKNVTHSNTIPFISNSIDGGEQVTITISCNISKIKKSKTDALENIYDDYVELPLPLDIDSQRTVKIHSFDPEPEDYRVTQQGNHPVLKCKYSNPDSVSSLRYKVDIIKYDLGTTSSRLRAFALGVHQYSSSTSNSISSFKEFEDRKLSHSEILFCYPSHPNYKEIVVNQRWEHEPDLVERARLIGEFIGTLPYKLPTLYDQIHYYLDDKNPESKNGFYLLYTMLARASGIPIDMIPYDAFQNLIFPNLRSTVFIKICYRELVRIDVLNKTRDNEYHQYYF
mmetsp:Transcript_4982/g.7384  ORF Transcript_4982/g.7384 Transcript_4982/m.7384 type:complete len:497 (+) Transcript_4982:47-1537(+)